MKKQFLLMSVFCMLASAGMSQGKKNVNTEPYPYANPVIRHMYTADAAPHVMPDGRVWMITSVDNENGGGYSTMYCYHAFSSSDMVNWTDHGEIFHVNDICPKDAPASDKWAVWAPDFIYKDGKYYLYIPIRIQHGAESSQEKRKVTAYIAVAESNSLTERFKVLSPQMKETRGIDPAVFRDTDGKIYLYWGSHMAAQLKDNMYEFVEKPVKLDVDTDRFMEAIWMNKHDGRYYLSYHTKYGNKIDKNNPDDPNREPSELAYSVGDSPMGPFKYSGVMNYELGVGVKNGPKLPGYDYVPWRVFQSNHGGIVEYHGQEYLFYHTSALSSWRQDRFEEPGTWTQRSVCIDKLNYNEDGSIIPVQQTLEGVDKVVNTQPYSVKLPVSNTSLKDGESVSIKNIDLGTGYYYFSAMVSGVKSPFKIEISSSSDNKLLGTLLVNKDGYVDTSLIDANGKNDISITVKGGYVSISDCRFIAGNVK